MSPKQFIDAAMELSPEARAEVAGELIRTLDPPPSAAVDKAWDAEIGRRIEKLNAGTARTISLEEARQRIRAAALGPQS